MFGTYWHIQDSFLRSSVVVIRFHWSTKFNSTSYYLSRMISLVIFVGRVYLSLYRYKWTFIKEKRWKKISVFATVHSRPCIIEKPQVRVDCGSRRSHLRKRSRKEVLWDIFKLKEERKSLKWETFRWPCTYRYTDLRSALVV